MKIKFMIYLLKVLILQKYHFLKIEEFKNDKKI